MRASSTALRAIVLAAIVAQPVMAGEPTAGRPGDSARVAPFAAIPMRDAAAADRVTTAIVDGMQVILPGYRTVRLPAFESPFEVALRAS